MIACDAPALRRSIWSLCFCMNWISNPHRLTQRQRQCTLHCFIHGDSEIQSQNSKGACKEFDLNKTLTAIWQNAGLLHAYKYCQWVNWTKKVEVMFGNSHTLHLWLYSLHYSVSFDWWVSFGLTSGSIYPSFMFEWLHYVRAVEGMTDRSVE